MHLGDLLKFFFLTQRSGTRVVNFSVTDSIRSHPEEPYLLCQYDTLEGKGSLSESLDCPLLLTVKMETAAWLSFDIPDWP
jgi:hypothetical protein